VFDVALFAVILMEKCGFFLIAPILVTDTAATLGI